MTDSEWNKKQREVCRQFGAPFVEAPPALKIGVAVNVRSGLMPINGMRHSPFGDTTGWYIWAGEKLSSGPDFFVPLHVEHLKEWRPEIIPFLGLAPGWRFLIGQGYVDVWPDDSLVKPAIERPRRS